MKYFNLKNFILIFLVGFSCTTFAAEPREVMPGYKFICPIDTIRIMWSGCVYKRESCSLYCYLKKHNGEAEGKVITPVCWGWNKKPNGKSVIRLDEERGRVQCPE